MKVTRHFARRFRLLAVLRGSFALGALADGAAAVALVLVPGILPDASGSGGDAAATPWLFAVLLAMLACCWVLAARDPRRYSGLVLVAILGRFTGAAVLGTWATLRPELAGLWPLAAVEAAFGLLHAATWLPLRI